MPAPELSVIVPLLNEAENLPSLLGTLSAQRGVKLELLFCDGGSVDGTVEALRDAIPRLPFPASVLDAPTGRPRQMNLGSEAARAEFLLFLHADSLFRDPDALRSALDLAARAAGPTGRVCGHFSLRFGGNLSSSRFGYYHLECKARLDRRECTHGDQGLLIRKEFFREIGPFDPSVPALAETRLADRARETGTLLLFPAEIETSPRRFEREGIYERQLLNAIIMNFSATGAEGLLASIPVYPPHGSGDRLQLRPVLKAIDGRLRTLPPQERRRFWLRTGRYVRTNAWQLAFFLDTRKNFRAGTPCHSITTPWLHFFSRLERLIMNRAADLCAACLTRLWFRSLL